MGLAEVGEFGFIARVAERIVPHAGVCLGIGDDCAITEQTPGTATLSTTDMLVEGIHFDLAYTDPHSLGRKSLAVNLSDIAAMGGIPRHVLLGLAIPPTLDIAFLDDFTAAFIAMADQYGVTLVGGDTCAAKDKLTIAVTLIGEQSPKQVIRRSGARPGDLVVVSGTVGDAALGLALLQNRVPGDAPQLSAAQQFCCQRQLLPTPRVALGQHLAASGAATAMIDISDGLLADLGHLLESGDVGAEIDAAKVPVSAAYRELQAGLPGDPLALALTGGEDYELLFTLPQERRGDLPQLQQLTGVPLTICGTITAATGLRIFAADGMPLHYRRSGYTHFT
jgi:thiamine-monophosphate kinase